MPPYAPYRWIRFIVKCLYCRIRIIVELFIVVFIALCDGICVLLSCIYTCIRHFSTYADISRQNFLIFAQISCSHIPFFALYRQHLHPSYTTKVFALSLHARRVLLSCIIRERSFLRRRESFSSTRLWQICWIRATSSCRWRWLACLFCPLLRFPYSPEARPLRDLRENPMRI